jgi:hypothetical protein
LSQEHLTAEQRRDKEHLVQASQDLAKASQLSQDFVRLLNERKAADPQHGVERASQSHMAQFKSLAKGMQRD